MAFYPTIRGVDNPIEASGLKGQYIVYALVVILLLFIVAMVLSNTGCNVFVSILVIGILLYASLHMLIYVSKKYGIHGLMKIQVNHSLPSYIRNCGVELNHKVK